MAWRAHVLTWSPCLRRTASRAGLRDRLVAEERARRERWQQDKVKELKEVTIKGLEPEVARILAKHKDDVQARDPAHLPHLYFPPRAPHSRQDDVLEAIERSAACLIAFYLAA